jgi:acetylornithine/N-succinyldiaminopimelate aminotransferase
MANAVMNTYNRLPITFERGSGQWLWDKSGRRFLDLISGIGVCSLGHSHPHVTQAICEQANCLVHASNLYRSEKQDRLAAHIAHRSQMERVFFCNSGAEANEAAVKIARKFGHQKGVDSPHIVVAEGGFHGRTLATLSATASRMVQAGFEPLVSGFVRVPYNDLRSLTRVARNNPYVVAILLEPIQGEGGVNIPDGDYLPGVRAICEENDWLMMLDEVQTGIGRTGEWFAWQHRGACPDVMTLAKALGNGVPMGACVARGKAARVFSPGSHGSTFGGNPLACSAALAVLETIDEMGLLGRATELGARMHGTLNDLLQGVRGVLSVRGSGLMIGVELDRPCADLVRTALDHGLLINVTAERVIRLLPPLILNESEAMAAVRVIGDLVRGFCAPA